jgi:hypothetical protein
MLMVRNKDIVITDDKSTLDLKATKGMPVSISFKAGQTKALIVH